MRKKIVMTRILLATTLAFAGTGALGAPTLQGVNGYALRGDRRVVLAQLHCVVGGGLCWNYDTRLAHRLGPAGRAPRGRAVRRRRSR